MLTEMEYLTFDELVEELKKGRTRFEMHGGDMEDVLRGNSTYVESKSEHDGYDLITREEIRKLKTGDYIRFSFSRCTGEQGGYDPIDDAINYCFVEFVKPVKETIIKYVSVER